jgi:hypothetical protein
VVALRGVGRLLGVAMTLPLVAVLSACANPASPSPTASETPVQTPSSPPSPVPLSPTPSGADELVIRFSPGTGEDSTWRLTCEPPGGNHPDPVGACRALDTNGAAALPPVPKGMNCTMIYGGPERATVTGTWRGQRVSARFDRTNGCEISRWSRMVPLLPAPKA